MNNISANKIKMGKNSFIHPTAEITGINGPADEIIIGDNVYIGERVRVFCNHFSLGDYSKIHHDTNVHGYKPCSIGHNAWIGQFCIIDSIGGTTLGNNCGWVPIPSYGAILSMAIPWKDAVFLLRNH